MIHQNGFRRSASPAPFQSFEEEAFGEADRESPNYVGWLQSSLNRALNLRTAVDGRIGPQTRSALRSFQRRAGLTPNGRSDLLTERELSSAGAGPPPGASASPGGGATWAGPAPLVASSAPPVINKETTPPAQTLYLNIPLGSESPARAMTGVFIPHNYRPEPEVDLIIYFHGFKPKPGLTIDRYWNIRAHPAWPLRERLNESGKNVVLVAPTLGDHSQTGKLTQPGGFDTYIAQVLAALAAHGPHRNTRQKPRLGKLILACHSGGGLPMRQLAMSKNRAAQHIRECWGFDCTYNRADDTEWARWAKAHPHKRLFIYYLAGTRTAVLSQQLKRLSVPNVFVAASPAKGHHWVPIRHWRERLEAAPLQARHQSGGKQSSSEQEWGWGAISNWFRPSKPATPWPSQPTAGPWPTQPPAMAPGLGSIPSPSPLALAVRNNSVALATQEWNRWSQGKTKESDLRMRPVLEDYWRTGVGYKPTETNWWEGIPWSAAFISWVIKKAGAGKDFNYSAGHSFYTAAAKENALKNNNNMFKAYPITKVAPRVGDIVCAARAGSGATYENIRGGMNTHCDIVTSVQPNKILAIGGNVGDSVSQKTVATDSNGRITEKDFFAVIRVGN